MSLIVQESNVGALRFYLRYGFAQWARHRYVPFPGSMAEGDWILLKKKIA
jgi:hypothetical protein